MFFMTDLLTVTSEKLLNGHSTLMIIKSLLTFFVIHQTVLHKRIQSSHFADDTCLLHIPNTISKINRSLSKDLEELSFWLNANKIALNVAKTAFILFKTKHKPCDTDLMLKLCRKRLNQQHL